MFHELSRLHWATYGVYVSCAIFKKYPNKFSELFFHCFQNLFIANLLIAAGCLFWMSVFFVWHKTFLIL